MPVLRTARLTLRPFRAADAPTVADLAGDRRVADGTLAIPHPYPRELADRWIASLPGQFAADEGPTWAIAHADDDRLLGAVGIRVWRRHALGELGFWLGVAHWGHGFATEAAGAAAAWAFASDGLAKLTARCFGENGRSAAVLLRLGFREEGLLASHLVRLGRRRDVHVFGRTADRTDA
jgi:RimJ/RimL family protein N-acetyltransferase